MLVPAATALVGLGFYFFAHPKVSEVGRLLFFVGAFWLASLFAHGHLHLIGPN